jgi:SAM-dependent methyltransferase
MAQLATTRVDHPPYILGHADAELDRLIEQARFFGDLTEHVLRLAGIERGMRVLDVGCGTGDVSFLAARLVGPTGVVVGVDRAAEAIEVARRRAAAARLPNVRFLAQDAARIGPDTPFDAVIGRLVLMYVAEPVALLRNLRHNLRPGGVVAFHEMDGAGITSEPYCPLFEATANRLRQTFAQAGLDLRVGLKLRRIFREAGLPEPRLIQGARAEGGPDTPAYGWLADLTRTLLPQMERTGVATADDVDIETLAARLREEALARDATLVLPPLIGAWARTSVA